MLATTYALALVSAVVAVELTVYTRMRAAALDACSGAVSPRTSVLQSPPPAPASPPAAAAALPATPPSSPPPSDAAPAHRAPACGVAAEASRVAAGCDAAQAVALHALMAHIMEEGLPALVANIRAAVLAYTIGDEWRASVDTGGPDSGSSGGSGSGGGGGAAGVAAAVAAAAGVPPPGATTPARLFQLIRSVRLSMEHAAAPAASDAEWSAAREEAAWAPSRLVAMLMASGRGTVVGAADGSPGGGAGASPAAAAPWSPQLLLDVTLDVVASPLFPRAALAAVDAGFMRLQAALLTQLFRLSEAEYMARPDAGVTNVRIAAIIPAARRVCDALTGSPDAAQAIAPPAARAPALTALCSTLMWDAKF